MQIYRICFIAILLNGSSVHAWENERPLHNTHYLNPLLKSTDPGVKPAAKSLLDCNARIIKALAPLLSKPRGELQTAGIELAKIASTKSIDPSTTHAVLSIAALLEEEDPSQHAKALELLEELKNTETSAENCALGRKAEVFHRGATASK